ncbi:hypothetical protein D3C85_1932130 [compost metagenome]
MVGFRIDELGFDEQVRVLIPVTGRRLCGSDNGGDGNHFIPLHAFVGGTHAGDRRTHDQGL